ncbi:hypothetical protein POJ06DRAFT_257705 [Lipomyces tetrasporus]|uniref:Uncharacterized protein n=1 Tax=Lipomyces tetrasporus TaxID=54092 RepID=A0AAD7QP04_9ASCO|nr:uncharacterized protein POJ06DRAFT_257705 [Lipomyces tetrasporus]KAJ8098684.1 hypothetical protein POJ06DRAFT_257705 [Lipomyces tetrasporus]
MDYCGKSQKTIDARRLITRFKDGERLSAHDMDLIDKFREKERLRQKKLRECKRLTAGPPKKRGRRPRTSTSRLAKPKPIDHGPTVNEAKHNSVTQHSQEAVHYQCPHQIGFSVNFMESSYVNLTDSWPLGPRDDYQQDSDARIRCYSEHLTTLFDGTLAGPPIDMSLHDYTTIGPSIEHWRMSSESPTLSCLYRMAATGACSTQLPPLKYSAGSPSYTSMSSPDSTVVTPVSKAPPVENHVGLYQNGPLLVPSLVFGTDSKCDSREPMRQGAIDVGQMAADIFTDHLYY